ncbi:MAG TPA: TlpA disulfide reductase family protein [Gemmatimonadales bacterium]|nr:TlpA disulfide reductase family protein [Gemmatimonadales bacterium]
MALRGQVAALLTLAVLGGGACHRRSGRGLTILFFGRTPAASLFRDSWAVDPDSSRLIAFDGALRPIRVLRSDRLATPVAVAALGSELLVTERTGEAVVFDTSEGALREWEGPDLASLYTTAAGRIVAARSPYDIHFAAEPDTAPLLRVCDTLGRAVGRLGTVSLPTMPLLMQLTNAGAIAGGKDGEVYFAPLTRDAIIKFDSTGAVRWTASRKRFASESDPVIRIGRDHAIDARYAVVNVALNLGPDGRLYALGGIDSAASRLRLDVIDTSSGALLATHQLGANEDVIAVDRHGHLALQSKSAMLARVPSPEQRLVLQPFRLPTLAGDTVSLGSYRGRVTLVNFWASWCEPCREEFPHMAELYRQFPADSFGIAAISDDVDRRDMQRFVDEYRPPFPVLWGAGRMKDAYHYRGLPYSVLLDTRGRIIARIFGFGGPGEFERLRQTIANAIRNP